MKKGLFIFAALLMHALCFYGIHINSVNSIYRDSKVDSLISKIVVVENSFNIKKPLNPQTDIYHGSWVTDRAHYYSSDMIPESHLISMKGYQNPYDGIKPITSKYGYRPRFKRNHKGVDIKVYTSDTIRSSFNGVVRVVKYDANGYGNFVVVRHPNGLETVYGHMSKHLCKVNDKVKAGDPLGLGGNTGRSFGSHLHFETRVVGVAIDPELLISFVENKPKQDTYLFKKANS